MKRKEYCKKYENCILTFMILLLNVLLMGVCFDFYYDLNDDTMMKDIMAGIYTGTPDGHNMQTLYILGALIAFCYRLCRSIPWYGLFLFLCQFGCFFLLGLRLTGFMDHEDSAAKADGNRCGKIFVLLILCLFQWGICLPHLVNIQYTITCALMSATAIFLFVTTPETKDVRQFVIRNIPSMILVVLAYQLRTEMLLLTLPFVALAGLFRWAEEDKIFSKENWEKYGTVVGIMLAGMLLSQGIDLVAYGNAEWRDFQDFFDERTTVYDFYLEVVTQDDFSEDLQNLGVTDTQQALLRNYNFGLDDTIDTRMMASIADYATETVGASRDWGAILGEKSKLYLYRIFHAGDAPYNVIVLWAYVAVLAAGLSASFKSAATGEKENESRFHRYAFVGLILLVAMVRTAVWMFILMRGRDPERITHSLYLVEFTLLAAMLVRILRRCQRKNYVMHGMAMLFILIIAGNLMGSVQLVQHDQRQRAEVNQNWQEIDAYCRAHEDSFYFEDVYSTVAFSQKMFANVNDTLANYDILGGWMCKSPLYQAKLKQYHIDSAADVLLYQDNVYLIMSDTEAAGQGFDWLTDYYADRGITVSVQQSDRINDIYAVYKVLQ
ncbi:MAG: hypothetical protein ACI4SN_06945 [Lachnospiraceae bacterium]